MLPSKVDEHPNSLPSLPKAPPFLSESLTLFLIHSLLRLLNITSEFELTSDRQVIEEQCSNSDCVSSYVSDLVTLNVNQFQCATFSSDEYPALVTESQHFYTDCRNKFNIDAIVLGEGKKEEKEKEEQEEDPFSLFLTLFTPLSIFLALCQSDAQCSFGGLNNKCNFITGRCIPSRELEIATVHCIIDGLTLFTEYYVKVGLPNPPFFPSSPSLFIPSFSPFLFILQEALDLPGRKTDSEFFNSFLNHFSRRECRNNLGHQTTLTESELMVVINEKCAQPYNCPTIPCLDTTCR
jgi:hypothetical protein